MKNIKNLGLLALIGLLVLLVMMSGCINECGKLNQSCCADNKCDEGVCSDGICEKCGGIGELCCPKSICKESMCSNGKCISKEVSSTTILTPSPSPTKKSYSIIRECEEVDDYTVGDPNNIIRSSASKKRVLGQFGCAGSSPYGPESGYATYKVQIPETGNWFISVVYSCRNVHSVSIDIYVDDEQKPRASFYPENTLDWNSFQSTVKINLGAITAGPHTMIFKTNGAKYGVADLDYFVLSME